MINIDVNQVIFQSANLTDWLFLSKYPSWSESVKPQVSVTLGLCFDFIPVTHI